MSTTPGWLIVAIVRASTRNRSVKPGSSSRDDSRIFTATVRPSTSSTHRHTSPMPPLAMRSSKRYRPPSMVPGLIISTSLVRASSGLPGLDRGLHDLAGDLCRLCAASGARVLDQYRHRHHRQSVLTGVPDEPTMVGRVAVLRRARLAPHLVPVDLRAGSGATGDDGV